MIISRFERMGDTMIRQQAFIEKRKMLKGCLHCHTTRSDGKGTPEEVIRLFRSKGYDFLALTDHRIYNFTNFAPETGLTIIPGMEFDTGSNIPCQYGLRCFHTVCLGPTKEDGNGFAQDERLEPAKVTNQEEYQPYLDDFHAKKNLTIYCHPQWSGTSARYFEKMKGNFAMEIWNSGAALKYDVDKDAAYWDELLGQDILIYGVAADDGHSMNRHGNGWVMVNAENNVNAILAALEAGKFYSSCGPEIYDFYVKDGKAYLDCSDAVMIRLHSDAHPSLVQRFEEGTTHAEFDLNVWYGPYKYIRMSVIDKNGKYAWTNPIFLVR